MSPQQTTPGAQRRATPVLTPADVQRRRRELALTQRWLRELRAIGGARPAATFARPVKH